MAISDRPWSDVSEADYKTAGAFCDACLIDLNPAGQDKSKALCKLPVKEPNGDVNRNALGAAAAVLAGARGGVDAPADEKRKAARKLMRFYAQAQMEAPDSVRRMAGA